MVVEIKAGCLKAMAHGTEFLRDIVAQHTLAGSALSDIILGQTVIFDLSAVGQMTNQTGYLPKFSGFCPVG